MRRTSTQLRLPLRSRAYALCRSTEPGQPSRSISINSGINRGLRESTNQSSSADRRNHRERKPWSSPFRDTERDGVQDGSRFRKPLRREESWRDDPEQVDFRQPNPKKGLDGDSRLAYGVPYTTAASTFVFGMRNVTAALHANRRKLYSLYLQENNSDRAQEYAKRHQNEREGKYTDIIRSAKSRGVPYKWTSRQTIDTVKASLLTAPQSRATIDDGVCLEASTLPQPPILSLGPCSPERGFFELRLSHQSMEDANINGTESRVKYAENNWRAPFLIWLHGVVDAGNVGAIMRSAIYFGADGIILSSRATASVSPGVLKSSAGAAEYLPIYQVNDYIGFISQSRKSGWTFYAAVAPEHHRNKNDRTVRKQSISMDELEPSPVIDTPCVLVLGNEDLGLPQLVTRQTNYTVSITGGSQLAETAGLDSLNVSVAAALLCRKFLTRPGRKKGLRTEHRHTLEQAERDETRRRDEPLF